MNKPRITLIMALILFSVTLVGAAPPVFVSAQMPELVMWVRDDYAWNLDQPIAAFQRDFGVTVRVEVMPLDAIRQRFPAEAAGDSAPDIITDSDELVRGYLEQNLLAPLDLGNMATDYIPFAIQAFSHEGRLFALPYALENLAFVRNTDMVPDAPHTWDEVYEIARTVRDSGAAEFGFVIPTADSFFYHAYPVISAYGGYLFATMPDGTLDVHDIGLNTDGTIAAATWLRRMVQDGLMPADVNWEDVHAAFEQGRAAMIVTGPWAIGRFDNAGVPFAVSALPAAAQPGRPFVHVQGFLLNARSDKKDMAQEFLARYIATPDTMLNIATHAGRVSAQMTVFEMVDDPAMRGFEDALQSAQRYPDIPQLGMINDVMSEALRQVITGNQPPPEVLAGAVANIRREIGSGQ
jgi:arabinogalactan oligomer/maltooligosaccharide transport system substrate-binding protein